MNKKGTLFALIHTSSNLVSLNYHISKLHISVYLHECKLSGTNHENCHLLRCYQWQLFPRQTINEIMLSVHLYWYCVSPNASRYYKASNIEVPKITVLVVNQYWLDIALVAMETLNHNKIRCIFKKVFFSFVNAKFDKISKFTVMVQEANFMIFPMTPYMKNELQSNPSSHNFPAKCHVLKILVWYF